MERDSNGPAGAHSASTAPRASGAWRTQAAADVAVGQRQAVGDDRPVAEGLRLMAWVTVCSRLISDRFKACSRALSNSVAIVRACGSIVSAAIDVAGRHQAGFSRAFKVISVIGVLIGLMAAVTSIISNREVIFALFGVVPKESIILVDRFDDQSAGLLSSSSEYPDQFERGYDRGKYFVRKIDPSWKSFARSEVPGIYSDTSVIIDAQIIGDSQDRTIELMCRWDYDTGAFYNLGVYPHEQKFSISRVDPSGWVYLIPWQYSSKIKKDNAVNTIELSCTRSTIAAIINGERVGLADDPTYQIGRLAFGAGEHTPDGATVEALFDNFVVRRTGNEEFIARNPTQPSSSSRAKVPASPTPIGAAGGFEVIASFDFDHPQSHFLPVASDYLPGFVGSYEDGYYVMDAPKDRETLFHLNVPVSSRDSLASVEFQLLDDIGGEYVEIACRQGSNDAHYRFSVMPSEGLYILSRYASGEVAATTDWQTSPAIQHHETNRIELGCVGDRVTASVNGTPVAYFADQPITEGFLWIGIGSADYADARARARVDNLIVRRPKV